MYPVPRLALCVTSRGELHCSRLQPQDVNCWCCARRLRCGVHPTLVRCAPVVGSGPFSSPRDVTRRNEHCVTEPFTLHLQQAILSHLLDTSNFASCAHSQRTATLGSGCRPVHRTPLGLGTSETSSRPALMTLERYINSSRPRGQPRWRGRKRHLSDADGKRRPASRFEARARCTLGPLTCPHRPRSLPTLRARFGSHLGCGRRVLRRALCSCSTFSSGRRPTRALCSRADERHPLRSPRTRRVSCSSSPQAGRARRATFASARWD